MMPPAGDVHGSDTGGPYPAQWQAFRRQEALVTLGIWTGVVRCPMGWTLVHDPQGTISDLRYERRAT
jgi:hypothetical protein